MRGWAVFCVLILSLSAPQPLSSHAAFVWNPLFSPTAQTSRHGPSTAALPPGSPALRVGGYSFLPKRMQLEERLWARGLHTKKTRARQLQAKRISGEGPRDQGIDGQKLKADGRSSKGLRRGLMKRIRIAERQGRTGKLSGNTPPLGLKLWINPAPPSSPGDLMPGPGVHSIHCTRSRL